MEVPILPLLFVNKKDSLFWEQTSDGSLVSNLLELLSKEITNKNNLKEAIKKVSQFFYFFQIVNNKFINLLMLLTKGLNLRFHHNPIRYLLTINI